MHFEHLIHSWALHRWDPVVIEFVGDPTCRGSLRETKQMDCLVMVMDHGDASRR